MNKNYHLVENWTEDELVNNLPSEETDVYEFKSSVTPINKLKEKLSIAASAFWNSGGGLFVAGVDNNGRIDGGIAKVIGRQALRDWVDQILNLIEPVGPYGIITIPPKESTSLIKPDCVVLIVSFEESLIAPHMAPDKKYYIRAGTHSGPAGHFLIEAIRAKRGFHEPMLCGLIRKHPNKPSIRELVITNLTNTPALNVSISLTPLPNIFEKHAKEMFPLTLPFIDSAHPFCMDLFVKGESNIFGGNCGELVLEYESIIGQKFSQRQMVDITKHLGPVTMGEENSTKICKILDKVCGEIKALRYDFTNYLDRLQNDKQE